MSETVGASELGLQIVEVARLKKGWTRTSTPVWWKTARTSRATLRRFWRGIAIRRETFQDICRVVGLSDWHFLTREWALPEAFARNLEALYWWAVGQSDTAERLAPGLSAQLSQPRPAPLTPAALHFAILYCVEAESETRARQLQLGLAQAGYTVVLVGDRQQQGLTWVQRLQQELARSDGLLVLLSRTAARSEWLTETVRQAREQQVERQGKPVLLPVQIGAGLRALNYDLQGYLQDLPLWVWHNDADLLTLIRAAGRQVQQPPAVIPEPPAVVADVTPLPDSQPLPSAAPETLLEHPSGQVELASRFYVPRPPQEEEAIAAVLQPGALIRIKAPRQMGKTSLMSRLLQRGRQVNYTSVPLSFQLADSSVFRELDRLLYWFCANVGRRLRLEQSPRSLWDATYSSTDNCTIYFEDVVLPHLTQPLLLGLDEVDRVFAYPAIADDFFGLLRAWHEAGKESPRWQLLRLVIVHSTEVYVPLDLNRSPFNVGVAVELPEFTSEQVQSLAQLHGLDWSLEEVKLLIAMVGGHPYLVRLALYHVARGYLSLPELLAIAPTEAGLYSDHLRRHLWQLEQYPKLEGAMEDVVLSETPVRLPVALAFKLHSMGLVHWVGSDVMPRCDLYRRYFRDRFGVF